MSNPIARQRYQTAREALARYRGALQSVIWFIVLIIPGGVILRLLGFSDSASTVITILGGVGVTWYVQHTYNLVYDLKPFPCRECSEDDDIAVTHIIISPWICGFCAKTHPPFNFFPWRSTLVDPCKNCDSRQHSVLCWRCDAPIIWDEDAYRPKTSAWHPDWPPLPEEEPPQTQTEDRPPRPIDEDLH